MTKIFQATLMLTFILTVDSCRNLTPLVSKQVDIKTVKNIAEFSNYYDANSKVRYGFGNDDSIFYIRLEFLEEDIAMLTVMNGLKLYFDASNRKKRNVFLNFPMPNMHGHHKDNKTMGRYEKPNTVNRDFNKAELGEMISEDAMWSVDEVGSLFNWQLEKTAFSLNISTNSFNQVIYEACIPIERIVEDGDRNFSVGVEIDGNSKKMQPKNGGRPDGMPEGSVGMGSGMPGKPGDMGSKAPGGDGTSLQKINFWFLVQLQN